MSDAEPKIGPDSNLAAVLNWYSKNYTYSESKMWFEAYLIKRTTPVPKNAYCVGNIGFICRMVDRGFPETDYVKKKIAERYEEWQNYKAAKPSPVEVKPVVKVESVIVKPVHSRELIEEISNFTEAYDENFWAEDKTVTTFKKYHFSTKLLSKDAKALEQNIQSAIAELEGVAALEKEYRDCYPSSQHIKRLLTWLNNILEVRKSVIADNLKPKKAIPPIKQVAEMRFLKEVMGIKGEHPEKVIGCTTVLMYNEKTRRLMYYEARHPFYARGMKFFEVTTHHCRTLRKPETQLKDLMSLTKPQVRAYINNLPGVNGLVQDRMNESVIILRVWRPT